MKDVLAGMEPVKAHRLLDATVHEFTLASLHSLIKQKVGSPKPTIIAHHNLHSLYLLHKDDRMKAFYEIAEFIHIDGMALVALGRLFGIPLRSRHRITYVDWIWPLMHEAAANSWRVFFLGSTPEVAVRAVATIRAVVPGILMEGHDGYFDGSSGSCENAAILARMRAFEPDILMVGMGMPRQEEWILSNLGSITAAVVLPCGACMDYVAGAVPTPPRWMGSFGVEWLYRLFVEPRRLWRRYLVEPWPLLWLVVKQLALKWEIAFWR